MIHRMHHTIIHVIAALCALAALSMPAHAADAAAREIIGFSPDGAYFAFEQFGVQDGSGFPYSDIFVLETATDTWVRGTPAHAVLRDEAATLEAVRAEARREARPILTRLRISSQHGRELVSDNADNARDAARFLPFFLAGDGPAQDPVRLRLSEIAMSRDDCAALGVVNRGFALVLEDESGQPLRILQEDTEIPASRGCPVHYGISDVLAFPRPGIGPVLVVLVSVYRFGFEGLDRRYIAIASTFDNFSNPSDQ
ncbi:DUF2259 domain-containing protein [Breoghania sp. L-A4]|uniref:DUF2259 domain-containing protein n=1 Tax=Breoghania sp. L-A4 TaxID=2304600 RepID=UPI000E35AC60|nr:DUF2259 domain-containing protein [Breoghania sp. L-A4]AXS41151.1 DUF2259 domain-containing protein [Breoghania sp. L-A4]